MQVGLSYRPHPGGVRIQAASRRDDLKEPDSGKLSRPSIDLDTLVFTERYREALQLRGCAFQGKGLDEAFSAALSLMPAAAAVSLAGEAARSLVGFQEEKLAWQGLIQPPPIAVAQMLEQADKPFPMTTWITECNGPGSAQLGALTLVPSLLEPEASAALAFVVGHEVEHLKSQDTRTVAGIEKLLQALQEPNLKDAARAGQRELSHAMEYRADEAGLDFALAQGFSHREVVSSAAAIVALTKASDTHPDGMERLGRLQQIEYDHWIKSGGMEKWINSQT